MAKTIKTIADLLPDEHNANRGTARGKVAIEKSLQMYGAGRSIVIDKNGRIIAGNKTVEQAKAAGIKDVVVIKTDGTKIVAVQRIDPAPPRRLAVCATRWRLSPSTSPSHSNA